MTANSKSTKDYLRARVDVDPVSGCWEWAQRLCKRGYPLTDRGKRQSYAHRLAFKEFIGPIPAGMTVDHVCFNPPCINPDHLRLLTHSDNSRNQRSAAKTHCANGHEYTPENTYMRPSKHRGGRRDCRTCIRERVAKYKERKSAA